MEFIPAEARKESAPCRFIPINEKSQTVDYFYRCGTQGEMEEALSRWLRERISEIEQKRGQVA